MKSFFKFVFIFLFCAMSFCTVSATPQYTLTDDGVLTIYAEKEGDVTAVDLIESTKYKHLIISGKTSSFDLYHLQLFATHCISIDLTEAELDPNVLFSQSFSDFECLEEFKCPKTVQRIGAESFYNCPNLKTIVLPQNLKRIGYSSFQNCPKLKVEIPKNVKIGEGAFRDSKVIRINPIPEPEPEVPSCRFCSWFLDFMGIGSKYDEKKNV